MMTRSMSLKLEQGIWAWIHLSITSLSFSQTLRSLLSSPQIAARTLLSSLQIASRTLLSSPQIAARTLGRGSPALNEVIAINYFPHVDQRSARGRTKPIRLAYKLSLQPNIDHLKSRRLCSLSASSLVRFSY
ncbi:hypothetical protein VPH35_066691 [Triticum aestivum]